MPEPMDIHAPHQPVHTWKDALIHIALITVGVFIALSFEGLTTWREHRALVREARANLTTEIEDNRHELQRFLKRHDATEAQLQQDLNITEILLGRKANEAGEALDIGTDLANLQDASRTTAEATGAFGLMEYAEVKRFAGVYMWQQQFLNAQQGFLTVLARAVPAAMAVTGARSPSAAMVINDTHVPSTEELVELRRELQQCITSALIERQMATALTNAYDLILGPGSRPTPVPK